MATIKSSTLYVKCSQSAFDELFEKFNKAVKQKQYKKFDYDAWCKIRKTIKERCSRVDNKIVPTSIHFDVDTKKYSLKMFQTFILMINPSVSFLSMS